MDEPGYKSIGGTLEDVGKNIRDNVPHLKIGSDKPKQPIPPDPLVEKLRRWVLIGLVGIVSAVAIITLLIKVIKMLL